MISSGVTHLNAYLRGNYIQESPLKTIMNSFRVPFSAERTYILLNSVIKMFIFTKNKIHRRTIKTLLLSME